MKRTFPEKVLKNFPKIDTPWLASINEMGLLMHTLTSSYIPSAKVFSWIFRQFFRFFLLSLTSIQYFEEVSTSIQAVAIQNDCCQISLVSNKMVDKIDLSSDKMKTML